jgi:hypothetical protein
MNQNENRKLLEGHGILWSYTDDEYSYEIYACSPYIKELGDKPYRILLVERIHIESNNRCWFTISQNLKLKFDDNDEPIPFDPDYGRNFVFGHYFENNRERAYIDFIKRTMKDNFKEFFPVENLFELNYL